MTESTLGTEATHLFAGMDKALRAYGEVNMRTWQELMRIQLDALTQGMDCCTQQLQSLNDESTPSEWLAAESEILTTYSQSMADSMRQTGDLLVTGQREALSCFDRCLDPMRAGEFGASEPAPASAQKKAA